MDSLFEFLGGILSEGGTLGLVSWGLTAALITLWKDYLKKGEPSNDAKRWLSIGVPVGVVVLAYFGGALLGYWVVDDSTSWSAIRVLGAELGGSKVFFTASKSMQGTSETVLSEKEMESVATAREGREGGN